MNALTSSSLRAAAFATTLCLLSSFASAKNSATADRAHQLLSTTGTLPVLSAGPYVEVGTFQIQVSAKLGRPSERLADGSWLYRNFSAEESAATGTLVVRFDAAGRVSDLSLGTPVVIAALRPTPKPQPAGIVVANQDRR